MIEETLSNINWPEDLDIKFWNAKPFPHVYIDNFLDEETFKVLSNSVLKNNTNPDNEFDNKIEGGKLIYSNENSPLQVQNLVDLLTHPNFISKLSDLTGVKNITSLVELTDEHDVFRYFHEMKEGGILGSHVDHSMVGSDNVHYLNSLFYMSPEWSLDWGGSTKFNDSYGFLKKAEVNYKPNRLVLFLHSSQSFHEVSRIKNNSINRFSLYMDYYIKDKNLDNLKKHANKMSTGYIPKFWRHQTTFVPSFEQFFNSMLQGGKKYIFIYIKYLLRRFLRKI